MQVQIDNVWATPSSLHLRVTVWGKQNKWRKRFDSHVPWEDIPDEAMGGIVGTWMNLQQPELPFRD